jgi:hypothetical protein
MPGNLETIKIQTMLVPLPVPTTHAPLPVAVTLGGLIGAGVLVSFAGHMRRKQ